MNGAPHILIVEDDPALRTLLGALLTHHGYASEWVGDGDAAVDMLRRSAYGAVLLDLMLPRRNGFEVLQFIRCERPSMLSRVIVLTAASTATLRDFDTARLGALMKKPFDLDELMETIRCCCDEQLSEAGGAAAV